MSPALKEFEAQALKFPSKDRALLASHLLSSLDNLTPDENEAIWLNESERRYKAYKTGNVRSRLASTALSDIRKKLL
ncbi:MAG: addiction module protein [Candidatus Omnitrophica bacterium]|nr:addiction module protein [Candidatus Omnitrophota bacterium]